MSRVSTLAEPRRGYKRRTGGAIEESSFYMRFSAGFRDRLLLDAMVIRRHDFLEKSYRAPRTNPARQPGATTRSYPEFDHSCCWETIWPAVLEDLARALASQDPS